MEKALPSIPAKRYFTIGEVSELCGVKPYVLRYWEQEFTQLKPMKRRGNRRYYQHHEVLLIRRIRDLLYDQGFTISGARNQLTDAASLRSDAAILFKQEADEALLRLEIDGETLDEGGGGVQTFDELGLGEGEKLSLDQVRAELMSIRASLLAG